MEEKFLYHIWDAGHLSSDLRTKSGKSIKINYSGQFNTFRGPDFINAIINIDGEDLQGAVEIHKNTQDWLKHNHQEDQFYNAVILHVVLVHNSAQPWTLKENGELVEILELQDQLSDDIQKLIRSYEEEPKEKKGDYCDRLSAIDNDFLLGILAQHGRHRFMGKVKRFNAALTLSDFNQILYEGMMEAAGYDKNKFNLLQLAQNIPYAKLREWQAEGLDCLGLISILLCSSGLLSKSKNKIDKDLFMRITDAYEKQNYYAHTLTIDWQLFRIRPGNHPLFRLIQLVEFLYSWLPSGLLKHFLEAVEVEFEQDQLQTAVSPQTRYQKFIMLFAFSPNSLLGANSALGKTVLHNIYINIYLPIMYLYAQKLSLTSLGDSLIHSYTHFKALPENYITRHMSRFINPAQIKNANSKTLYQQGLMDIYYRYCRYRLCGECTSKQA